MSSGQQAVHDECEWDDVCRIHKLPKNWGVYSKEARFANEAIRLGFKNSLVVSFVEISLEQEKRDLSKKVTAAEYATYLELHRKYGKVS